MWVLQWLKGPEDRASSLGCFYSGDQVAGMRLEMDNCVKSVLADLNDLERRVQHDQAPLFSDPAPHAPTHLSRLTSSPQNAVFSDFAANSSWFTDEERLKSFKFADENLPLLLQRFVTVECDKLTDEWRKRAARPKAAWVKENVGEETESENEREPEKKLPARPLIQKIVPAKPVPVENMDHDFDMNGNDSLTLTAAKLPVSDVVEILKSDDEYESSERIEESDTDSDGGVKGKFDRRKMFLKEHDAPGDFDAENESDGELEPNGSKKEGLKLRGVDPDANNRPDEIFSSSDDE